MPGQSSSKLVPQVLPKANIASVKLCWHFSRGFCRLGAACGFAHGTSETIKLANAYEANLSSSPGTIAPVMPMKTKLCSFFCRGECNKGSACTFAHGEHELTFPKMFPMVAHQTDSGGALASDPCRQAPPPFPMEPSPPVSTASMSTKCRIKKVARNFRNIIDDDPEDVHAEPLGTFYNGTFATEGYVENLVLARVHNHLSEEPPFQARTAASMPPGI